MVNKHINKEIFKAIAAFGFSLIEEAEKEFKSYNPKTVNRETQEFTCSICGKQFVELNSLRTPVYLRYRNHYWRCEKKEFEQDLQNFHESEPDELIELYRRRYNPILYCLAKSEGISR